MSETIIFIAVVVAISLAFLFGLDLLEKRFWKRNRLAQPESALPEFEGPVTKQMWKAMPFGIGTPLPYYRRFSADEFTKVKQGLLPGAMEDRWFIYFEEPFLFFHYSWTGEAVFRTKIQVHDGWSETIDVIWEDSSAFQFELEASRENQLAWQTALLDWIISCLLLKQATAFPSSASFGLKS